VDLAAENICDKIIADFEQFGAKRDVEPQAAAS
jgi:hypothetical protein